MVARLKQKYLDVIKPAMKSKFDYKNEMQIPKLDKIVVNMGVGQAVKDSKEIQNAVKDLTLITGQKPAVAKARKSVATFKLREGMPIGCKVTLRGERMYEFFDRLVTIAMPRIRDFRGVSDKSFDGNGNYAMGLKDHSVFPEINLNDVTATRGMDIIICTTADSDDEARALLTEFKMPFSGKKKS